MATGNPATDYSVALLGAFVRAGVTDVVLCPGSRSQALALAAAELERVDALRLHVRLDERSAGFLALGLAVESRTPTIVLTTSGTAVANLHPAALEAFHSGVPLILLTADRPEELRGIGANQTTVQPGLFGPVIDTVDVAAPEGAEPEAEDAAVLARGIYASAIDPGRPVHLNIAFRDPLSSAVPDLTAVASELAAAAGGRGPEAIDATGSADEPLPLAHGPRTVVIAGHGAGEEAERIAREGGWPLLAEVTSGARFGPNLVVAFRELLNDDAFGARIERVVVFGHPTLTREVPTLLRRPDVEMIVVGPSGGQWYNPARRAAALVGAVAVTGADPDPAASREWLGSWVFTSRGIVAAVAQDGQPDGSGNRLDWRDFARAELAVLRTPVTRQWLVDAVWRVTWPHDRLVLGASRLIREADGFVPGKRIRVHANRGLAGIDGTIATATGVAIASQRHGTSAAGVTRVLVGDLTLLHDVGSLLGGYGEEFPRIQVIVGNDGGGTIFDGLEVARSAAGPALDRVLFTPQRVDLAALAAAYGWDHRVAATTGELSAALTSPPAGPSIVEVPLARRESGRPEK
ncbi:2-succinyl-5-enolpyruvyl-6-hydroxy-3-cyclohexene-1-carboxylic-acid synthase [Planctomonas psychrotolerans]|uniref:2-succinyl-5-enolpyruvyl-6-hydroxy-3- cyclohexene-1-carboxylic-acid synthase n=1 Tax=Planctomonas psychrotolerans TaxID=2528712 RepID=UPI001D0CF02B|nr:2-succinyl-5-enolpyruvyl-6-hydroxy-3-cyclohexene-1-carboxylic-acid synthase [Planctomonas psychrotolerans]